MGKDWEAFKASLKHIRQFGFSMTVGDYNAGIISIAAPLFNREGEVLGSLAIVASNLTTSADAFRDYAQHVVKAAKETSARIAANESIVALPARALG
jgi:DNA-binding IclR family transcriptional regulator